MYNPRAPALAPFEHTEVSSCVKNSTHKVKEDAKKKEEHLYFAMSTVKLPLSPVYGIFTIFTVFQRLHFQSMENCDSLPTLTGNEL